MSTITLEEAVSNFYKIFKDTIQEAVPIRIQDLSGNTVVVIPENDFKSMEETLYLLTNPQNFTHLIEALSDKRGVSFNSIQELKNAAGI